MEEKKNIGHLFDRIAGTYDKFNHLLSLNIDKSWRKKAVKRMDAAQKVLDVAIGTADLAIEMMKQGKAQSITGIDLSTQMMALGQQKVDKLGFGGSISFMEASALEMPFEASAFDAVTCSYGVRNFSDLDKGLSEMHRVLRPGGQLMILEFSYPTNPVIRFFYDFFFTRIMPLVGRLVSNDPSAYTYFKHSVKGFIWGEEMAGRIRQAGFSEVSFRTLTFGITTIYMARKS